MGRLRKYESLLPMYLGGDNITAHCEIMDEEDKYIDDTLYLLEGLFELDRPILVEKAQTSLGTSDITVHINSPDPVRSITITGDYEYTVEYDWDDLVTDTSVEFPYSPGTRLTNPNLTVTVETHKDVTYTKCYPENDTVLGDGRDHDEYLDVVGNLLGIPRRNYREYNITNGAEAYPPYFGKELIPITSGNSTNYIVQPCTEDDYYYSMRLQNFMSDFAVRPLPINMLSTLHGYKARALVNARNLTPTIFRIHYADLYQQWGGTEALVQAQLDEVGGGIFILYVDNEDLPVNYYPFADTAEKQAFIQKYFPCTRIGRIGLMADPIVYAKIINYIPGQATARFFLTIGDNAPLVTFPITLTVDDLDPIQVKTDKYGYYYVEGLGSGSHTITITADDTTGVDLDYTATFEIPTFTDTIDDIYYMNEDEDWIIVDDITSTIDLGSGRATATYTITEQEEDDG